MNQKQIKTICYAVLFILGGLLTGCELEEDVIQKNAYRERLAIRNSTFDALSKEQPFVQALSGLNKGKHGKGSFSGTIMEAQYGFTILPDKAVVIEKEGKTSYTFQIVRETPDSTYFENLVIHTDNPGSTRAFIVKYTPEVPIVPSVTHESFYFSGAIRITPIEYNAELAGKKIVCVTATVMMCDQSWSGSGSTTPHVATQYCNNPNHLFEVTTTTCDMVAGGGSFGAGAGQYSGGDGMGGTGGGGGDGEPGNDDGLTPPNPCPRCPDFTTVPVLEPSEPAVHCDKLKELLKSAAVKNAIRALNSEQVFGGTKEKGYNLALNPQNKLIATEVPYQSTGESSVRYSQSAMLFGGIHCHLFSHFPMFSHDDVAILSGFYTRYNYSGNNGVPDPTIPVHILVSEIGVYAISADDVESLNKLNSIYSNPDDRIGFQENMENKYRDLERREQKGEIITTKDYQEVFLKFLKENNLNISLYKTDEGLTEWAKLVLKNDLDNSINNDIILINCN